MPLDRWLNALHERHVAPYRPLEFTRALRALSARYVERRGELPARSALDSAGKRAAFAAFYAPLHYLTVRAIVQALPPAARTASSITDLGCGTGVGAAGWQGAQDGPVRVVGIDESPWALEEAKWNWRELGLQGRVRRGDFVAAVAPATPAPPAPPALLLAWSVNELPRESRERLRPLLIAHAGRGLPLLIVEPLARGAARWWDDWAAAFATIGGRADEWKFDVTLPSTLNELSERAGFRREYLGARSIWVSPPR